MDKAKKVLVPGIFCEVSPKGRRRILVNRDNVYQGNLLLVNQEYPIQREPSEEELEAPFPQQPRHLLKKEVSWHLRALLEAVKAGTQIVGVSGYRTLAEQVAIWRESEEDNGLEYTQKYVAIPNHSEHQTGLAMDLALNREEIDFICPDFPYEGICQQFRSRAAAFGFIERYPAGREFVTGIGAEPWHFRYVGVPHAALMMEQNMVFEEYIEWIKGFELKGRPLIRRLSGHEVLIGFMPCPSEKELYEIMLSQHYGYQISGNNADGVIVTVWT